MSYGNYSATEDRLAVNIPIVTDQLGINIAGDFNNNDGRRRQRLQRHQDRRGSRLFPERHDPLAADKRHHHRFYGSDIPTRTTPRCARRDSNVSMIRAVRWVACRTVWQRMTASTKMPSSPPTSQASRKLGDLGLPGLGIKDLSVQSPEVFNRASRSRSTRTFSRRGVRTTIYWRLTRSQRLTPWLDMEVNAGYDHGSTISCGRATAIPRRSSSTRRCWGPTLRPHHSGQAAELKAFCNDVLATEEGHCLFCNTACQSLQSVPDVTPR